jgi:hypothetical protein
MPKSFADYVYRRLLNEVEDVGLQAPAPGQDTVSEKKQKIKSVQATFSQARQDLAKLVDDKFDALLSQIQKSFGSQQKVDSVARNQIVQVLGKIANKISSWGDQEVQYASPEAEQVPSRVSPVAAEAMHRVNNLLIEAELYVEDNASAMKIQSVKSYLDAVKGEIMQNVDNTLKALQNDAVMKMMADIQKSVSNVQGIVSGQSPLNATEQMDAYYNLQQLGNAISMSAPPKLKFGERLPKSTSPVQIILGGGHSLNFDPSDRGSIQSALGKMRNPRSVRIKIGDKIETVDVSNKQQMADIVSAAQELMGQGGAQLNAANQVASGPLRKLKLREPKPRPSMPVALGPGVGANEEV